LHFTVFYGSILLYLNVTKMPQEQSENPEIYQDPFDGLTIESPAEQLAFAELWNRILELDDHGSADEQIFAHQIDRLQDGLYRAGYKGYRPIDQSPNELDQEASRIGYNGPRKWQVLQEELVSDVRWRLSDLNKEDFDDKDQSRIELVWDNSSESKRDLRIAELKAELDELLISRELRMIVDGDESAEEKEEFLREYKRLGGEVDLIAINQKAGNSGWGSGTPN